MAHEFFISHPQIEGGNGYQILEGFALMKRPGTAQLGEL